MTLAPGVYKFSWKLPLVYPIGKIPKPLSPPNFNPNKYSNSLYKYL